MLNWLPSGIWHPNNLKGPKSERKEYLVPLPLRY